MVNYSKLIEDFLLAAKKASEAILAIYHSDNFEIENKIDDSPVTKADKESDKIITAFLKTKYPNFSFLTEESEDDLSRLDNDYVFIIDPLDGTKDFIARNDEFTINIALSYKHEIVAGLIYLPVLNEAYYAYKDGGAFYLKNNESTRIFVSKKTAELRVFTSNFHFNKLEEEMINKHKDKIKYIQNIGSSIKGCYIARGLGEISYRFSPNTKEWDIAAMQIIVDEAGGYLLKPNKERFKYNRVDVYNRDGYIICNSMKNFLL